MTLDVKQPPDEQLVGKTLAGDQQAFGMLFDRYARVVRAVFVGLVGDDATIHDLTQEVFLRAFRNLSGLLKRDQFGPWVVGIARRVDSEKLRSLRRDRHRFLSPETFQIETTDDDINQSMDFSLVMEQLRQLPEQERLAIQMFFLEEQNADVTAELLGLSRSGTYALLKRACNRLASMVDSPGDSPT